MAILRNQDVSDDEFDMIDPEPVSDLSTPEPDAQGSSRNFTTPLSPPEALRACINPAGREGIPGLKYTKSVYQKLWGGKDALIAVMGK
ncbi:hypothetical protein PG987_001931 [Apiospora arundinis]